MTIQVRHPKAEGYNIQVGEKWFRTVAGPNAQIRIGTTDSLAPRIDQSSFTQRAVLDLGYAWARTDLSGGEGLDFDPREDTSEEGVAAVDVRRYWDSVGLNVERPETAGQEYSLRLARGVRVWPGDTTLPIDLGASATFVYIADGETISWYSSWNNTTPVASAVPSAGNDIIAIAVSPNNTVMATTEDGDAYVKGPNDVTFASVYSDAGGSLKAQGIWYVNGRFILSVWDTVDVAQLLSLDWTGSTWTEVAIDSATGPYWSVVESGPAVVAVNGDGTVRTYTPNNANDGDMSLIPRARTTMPVGETPVLLGSNAGVLLILTGAEVEQEGLQELRLYQAEVLDARFDFVVGQIQLRRQWLGTEHEPLVTRNMAATRDEIFFFIRELVKGVLQEALWRFDIITNGLSRVFYEAPSNLNGLVSFDGILGGIDFNSEDILLADPTIHQTFGYMIFPNITFGLNTQISWLTTIVEAEQLDAPGARVEIWRSTTVDAILDWEHPSWTLIQSLSSQGASNFEYPLVGVESRTISLQLRVFASSNSAISPRITRTAIRGIPSHRDLIMLVPFNVSDYVSAPGRRPTRIPGLGDKLHNAVLSAVGKNVQVQLLDPPVLFRGIIDNVEAPVQYVSQRGSVTRYSIVQFRGQKLPEGGLSLGTTGMGLGRMGLGLMGTDVNPDVEE